jgi:hypothetical protein
MVDMAQECEGQRGDGIHLPVINPAAPIGSVRSPIDFPNFLNGLSMVSDGFPTVFVCLGNRC